MTGCGRICFDGRKINFGAAFAGQKRRVEGNQREDLAASEWGLTKIGRASMTRVT
jgi:hypothetical protein